MVNIYQVKDENLYLYVEILRTGFLFLFFPPFRLSFPSLSVELKDDDYSYSEQPQMLEDHDTLHDDHEDEKSLKSETKEDADTEHREEVRIFTDFLLFAAHI